MRAATIIQGQSKNTRTLFQYSWPKTYSHYGLCFTHHIAKACMAIKGNNMHTLSMNNMHSQLIIAVEVTEITRHVSVWPTYSRKKSVISVICLKFNKHDLMLYDDQCFPRNGILCYHLDFAFRLIS